MVKKKQQQQQWGVGPRSPDPQREEIGVWVVGFQVRIEVYGSL